MKASECKVTCNNTCIVIVMGFFNYFLQHKCLFSLDIPGKTAKTLKELKDAITESKAKSKGVSKRDLEDELRKAASDKGLKISDNDGEGNCLFHALSEQLKIVGDKDISYDKLREALVQYLTDNSELVGSVWYL